MLPPCAEHYPYLLVSIGSGVSMVRVDGENKFTRVSGACWARGGAAGGEGGTGGLYGGRPLQTGAGRLCGVEVPECLVCCS